MKLAYLIAAYADEKNLCRLIKALNFNADFFIHIDQKKDINIFKNALVGVENVHFCENRFFVNWGAFAQVLYQRELLRCVFDTNIRYERLIFIGGTDYPIWSNKKIALEFKLNADKEYISAKCLTRDKDIHQLQKISLYHFFRDIKFKNIKLKKCFSGPTRQLMRALPIRKKTTVYLNSKESEVYFGGDLFGLTFNCAKYVYQVMCNDKKFMKYFKYSFAPSELVIPTIVFNSDFVKNACLLPDNTIKLEDLLSLHHIDYSDIVKVFDENDYDILIDSGKMLFRKAITGKSDGLLDKIDLLRSE
ncbi:beta-1,6-N-acetylglucosaminyltransferase [Mucilaginibacter sp.]